MRIGSRMRSRSVRIGSELLPSVPTEAVTPSDSGSRGQQDHGVRASAVGTNGSCDPFGLRITQRDAPARCSRSVRLSVVLDLTGWLFPTAIAPTSGKTIQRRAPLPIASGEAKQKPQNLTLEGRDYAAASTA